MVGTPYKLYIVGGFSNGEQVKCVTGSGGTIDVEQLYSTQEEADTRIFLHVNHSNGVFADSLSRVALLSNPQMLMY